MPSPETVFDTALEFASELFEAALEPERWPRVLAELAARLGGERLMLLRAVGGRRIVLATSEFTPAEVRRLAGHRTDTESPHSRDADRLVCPPAFREIPLDAQSRMRLLLDRRDLSTEAETLVSELAPLVVRAWRLTDALAASRRHEGWRSDLLERLPSGVLVLDGAGRALRSNGEAARLLATQRDLALVDGLLQSPSGALSRALAELLDRGSEAHRRGATLALHLPREGRRSPLEVLLVASPRFGDTDPEAVAVAILFESERGDSHPAAVLARRCGLGFEQAQVVDRLLRGEDIPAIGRSLGVPREAIVACLRDLYDRLGTTRQVELLQVLLSGGLGSND